MFWGLNGVGVLVEGLSPDALRGGLTRRQLAALAQRRLRKAGIRVLSRQERLKAPGGPFLYVCASVTKIGRFPIYTFTVEVALSQGVSLVRDPQLRSTASTWSTQSQGHVGSEAMADGIRSIVGDKVDEFINAYLAANPRKPKAD